MSSGKIVTLISKDVYIFDSFLFFTNIMCIATMEGIIMTFIMYAAIGVSGLIGVGLMVITVPIQCK